jgi:integrase
MRFTDKGIAALKPKAERYEVWEDGKTGLGVRVSTRGRKSWIYMYRFDGRARRMTLGTYPPLTLANARVLQAKAKESKEKGEDPGVAHIAERRAERQAHTVADLVEEYLEKHARPNKRSAAADERTLQKEIIPVWGRRKAKEITRRDIITILDNVVDRGSPVMANRLLALLRRMFAFAVERDILGATPCVLIKAPTKETPRDRVLSSTEIATFWHGLEKASMAPLTRLALQLMLVTAQRRNEVVSAPWSEFSLSEGVWEIPAARSKNGSAHRVPLSFLACDLLNQVQERGRGSLWLFPSPQADGLMDPTSVTRAMRVNLSRIGVENATPHDLRRTAASHMTEMGIQRLVVSKVLGHSDGSVTAIYDRFEYGPQKKQALDAWSARLEEIISGKPSASNVVSLATAGEAQ